MKVTPVVDSVPKVNNELAVGSDPEFQRLWVRAERVIWSLLILFLAAAFAGLFGRGPLANAEARAADGSFAVKYERVQRYASPSVITVEFQPEGIQNGQILLWVSDSLVKPLGNQRVVPQPLRSELRDGGILYTFPANPPSESIEFQTQPTGVGRSELEIRIPGHGEIKRLIWVMP
jgi:hypothetical protein